MKLDQGIVGRPEQKTEMFIVNPTKEINFPIQPINVGLPCFGLKMMEK